MWEMYEDDESFQRMARGKGVHDAKLLARVLYGKTSVRENEVGPKVKRKRQSDDHVHFKLGEGKFEVDSKLLQKEDNCEETVFMSRGKDYTFKPVKECSDFRDDGICECVQTDIFLFDRSDTSEYDTEKEELKDHLVAWQIRFEARSKKIEE